MLCEQGLVGSKSYLECLSGVSFSIGKSFGRRLIGKQGRSLGIRYSFGEQVGGFLYLQEVLLTDVLI